MTTTFKFSGGDENRMFINITKLLYDRHPTELIFKDGNKRNLTKENIIIRDKTTSYYTEFKHNIIMAMFISNYYLCKLTHWFK